MVALLDNLRYAARQLRRRPVFALAAIATLALGIGANAAFFSVYRTVVLRPLPYADPDRVVMLWNSIGDRPKVSVSGPEYFDYRSEVRAFEDLAAYRRNESNLFTGGEAERVSTSLVSANLFGLLGAAPVVGRAFTPEEEAQDPGGSVLLAYDYWRRRFGADPSILGRQIEVDGVQATVIGVTPPDFRLPEDFASDRPTQLWMPLGLTPGTAGTRGLRGFTAVGRLRSGVSVEQANAELRSLTARWTDAGITTTIEPFSAAVVAVGDELIGDLRRPFLLLFVVVGLVLLIATANVASLMMTRGEERSREFALRLAIGARGRHLVRQVFAESLVLAAVGGFAGLVLAQVTVRAIQLLGPSEVPRLAQLSIDLPVLAFTGAVVILSAVLVGLLPARRAADPHLASSLKEGGRGATGGRDTQRIRSSLVVAQVAVSVVLLIGASLLIRSLREIQRVDLGFHPENVLTLQVTLQESDYPDPEDMAGFYSLAIERLEETPGVVAAGAVASLPLAQSVGDWGIDIEGRVRAEGERFFGYLQIATPGYHEAMRVPVVDGRLIADSDRPDGIPVVVVNRTMADRYWPGTSAIGQRIRIRGFEGEWFTIVGVVADARHNAILEDRRPEMFFPHAQLSSALGGTVGTMNVTVRTAGPPLEHASAVREVVASIDRRLPISAIQPMTEIVAAALAERRFTTLLLTAFAGAALLLGVIGIYGVVAYSVSRRIPEIGIRMALGAGTAAILKATLFGGLSLVTAGLAIGLTGAFGTTRLMQGMLYGVSATDPTSFVVVPAILGAAALLACWIPARRAARVDPLVALRSG